MKTKTVVICEICDEIVTDPGKGFLFPGGVTTAGTHGRHLLPDGAVHQQCFANKFQLRGVEPPERTER